MYNIDKTVSAKKKCCYVHHIIEIFKNRISHVTLTHWWWKRKQNRAVKWCKIENPNCTGWCLWKCEKTLQLKCMSAHWEERRYLEYPDLIQIPLYDRLWFELFKSSQLKLTCILADKIVSIFEFLSHKSSFRECLYIYA